MCGEGTPFDFVQGRLCPPPLTFTFLPAPQARLQAEKQPITVNWAPHPRSMAAHPLPVVIPTRERSETGGICCPPGAGKLGCPSIRAKAVSRTKLSWRCDEHRFFAREVEDQDSGNLTLNHPAAERRSTNNRFDRLVGHDSSMRTSHLYGMRERPINFAV